MAVRYEPKKILRRMASRKKVEKLLTKKLSVNKAALNSVEESGVLGKKELEKVALTVIKDYKKRANTLRKQGATKAEAIREISEDPRLLVQRIQNATVAEITTRVKAKYRGEYYRWLKSTAVNPDPKHRKKWGKIFRLGKGEAPGDRYGCQCGMEILVSETKLDLEE